MKLNYRTVSAKDLQCAYEKINPSEASRNQECAYANWLKRYEARPPDAIATCNWYGKVTVALFAALGIRKPRSKSAMLVALYENTTISKKVAGPGPA